MSARPASRRGRPPSALAALAAAAALAAPACGGRADRSDGAVLYANTCATCHGADGRGDPTARARYAALPDLTDAAWHVRVTDEYIAIRIRGGSPDKGMPPFSAFTDAQLRGITGHVRTLRR